MKILYAAYPGAIPRLAAPAFNLPVLLVVFAVSMLTSILSGSIPALQPAPLNLQVQLAEGGRNAGSTRHQRARSFLVIAEVALAMMLLAAAGLLIRSFTLLQRVDPGFDSSHLAVVRSVTARFPVPGASGTNSVCELGSRTPAWAAWSPGGCGLRNPAV